MCGRGLALLPYPKPPREEEALCSRGSLPESSYGPWDAWAERLACHRWLGHTLSFLSAPAPPRRAPPGCAQGWAWPAEAPPPRARTTLPHDQDVPALILDGQEDLRDHDEDPALGGRRDVPHALRVGRVVAGVVGGLDVARVVAELATAVLVCGRRGPWAWSGGAGRALHSLAGPGRGWQVLRPCWPTSPRPSLPVFPGGPLPCPRSG